MDNNNWKMCRKFIIAFRNDGILLCFSVRSCGRRGNFLECTSIYKYIRISSDSVK